MYEVHSELAPIGVYTQVNAFSPSPQADSIFSVHRGLVGFTNSDAPPIQVAERQVDCGYFPATRRSTKQVSLCLKKAYTKSDGRK